jgi:hypothetical protein
MRLTAACCCCCFCWCCCSRVRDNWLPSDAPQLTARGSTPGLQPLGRPSHTGMLHLGADELWKGSCSASANTCTLLCASSVVLRCLASRYGLVGTSIVQKTTESRRQEHPCSGVSGCVGSVLLKEQLFMHAVQGSVHCVQDVQQCTNSYSLSGRPAWQLGSMYSHVLFALRLVMMLPRVSDGVCCPIFDLDQQDQLASVVADAMIVFKNNNRSLPHGSHTVGIAS